MHREVKPIALKIMNDSGLYVEDNRKLPKAFKHKNNSIREKLQNVFCSFVQVNTKYITDMLS